MFKGFTVQHFDGNKTFKVYMHVENVINRFCVYICDYWKSIKHNYNLINFSYSTDLNQD